MANPFQDEPAQVAAGAPQAPVGTTGSTGGVSGIILNAKIDTLLKIMRVINILNGIGLAFSCYFAFTVVDKSVTRFFLATYIGIFALLLLAFELRFKTTEPFVKRMFGFMYSYSGRTVFLIFVGAINFGFIESGDTSKTGTKVVISIGAVTLTNAFFNCFVLCKHPAFKSGAVPPGQVPKMTDEEMLAYIQSHPELLRSNPVGPAASAPKKEPNPFEEGSGRFSGMEQAKPAAAPAPAYTPPAVPKSPAKPVAPPQNPSYDDGENPFAQ